MRIWMIVFLVLQVFIAEAQTRHLKKVNKYLDQNDTVAAMKQLNKMIAKHSVEAALYLKRAQLKISRGDLSPALIDLNSFCTYNQTCGEALFLKGLICYRQQNYHAAIGHLSDYSRKHDDPNGWIYLGLSHLNLSNFEVAQNAFSKALENEPGNFNAHYNAGLAAYKQGEFKKSLDYFSAATNLFPASVDAWIGLGLSYTAQASFEASNKALRQAIAIEPNHGAALYNIGVNYHGMDDHESACSYWTRAKEAQSQAALVALERYCSETADKGH